MSVRARTIVITGANRGLGLEMVRQLVSSDTPPQHLFAACRDPDAATDLNNLAKKHPVVHIVKLDVRNEEEYRSFVEKVRSQVGDDGLNMLINNSGISTGPTKKCTLDEVTQAVMVDHFVVNAAAPLLITKAFLPLLRMAAKNSEESVLSHERASVFNMGSQMGCISDNWSGRWYSYRVSKCALHMVTMSLHRDLSPEGILCVSLHPGWAQTDMGGPKAKVAISESVQCVLKVMAEAKEEEGGNLINFQGKTLPW